MSLNAICRQALESYIEKSRGGRSESREGSDIDLLVVLGPERSLSRSLYSLWDERFGVIKESPHFVHIPVDPGDAGPIWLEASVDGVVLFDHDDVVSRFLGSIRRLIASGDRKRRWAHVVREAQELVEIILKALLRAAQIEVPGIHDVSPLLEQNRDKLPAVIRPRIDAQCDGDIAAAAGGRRVGAGAAPRKQRAALEDTHKRC